MKTRVESKLIWLTTNIRSMSSFGCTILLDCLVVPEDGLQDVSRVPARGWEYIPDILADLSQFPIVHVHDVLDQRPVTDDVVLLKQVPFVHFAERLKPASGWV